MASSASLNEIDLDEPTIRVSNYAAGRLASTVGWRLINHAKYWGDNPYNGNSSTVWQSSAHRVENPDRTQCPVVYADQQDTNMVVITVNTVKPRHADHFGSIIKNKFGRVCCVAAVRSADNLLLWPLLYIQFTVPCKTLKMWKLYCGR